MSWMWHVVIIIAGVALFVISYRGIDPIDRLKWRDLAVPGCLLAISLIFVSVIQLFSWARA